MQPANSNRQHRRGGKAVVAFPAAYSIEEQSIVRIEDAPTERGHRYSCVHCKQAMSAVVLATRRAAHFRHTAPEGRCDPDDALHTFAIRMIQQAHDAAVASDGRYLFARSCVKCKGLATEIDLADGWKSDAEKSIVPRTRSDLVFSHADGRRLAVEVVVSHEMESEAEAAYRDSSIPVGIVRPQWDTVERLLDDLVVDDSQNFRPHRCAKCDAAEKERNAELEADRIRREGTFHKRQRSVDTVLAKMERRRSSRPLFRPWYYGKSRMLSSDPTPMYPQTQRRVFANAIILTELGFEQHNQRKPWLFRYPIHKGQDVILYADLGGSDVVPIYEDTAAMLYVFGQSLYADDDTGHAECCTGSPISRYIVVEAASRLQQFGVDIRTGFMSPVHTERLEPNPLEAIDHKLLVHLVSSKAPGSVCLHTATRS